MFNNLELDDNRHPLLKVLNNGKQCERLDWPGCWKCFHFNLHTLLEAMRILKDQWPEISELGEDWSAFGVCDSPAQFMELYGQALAKSPRRFIVQFVEVRKDKEPEWGGWRWHKWGPYVGTQEPTTEYMHDEPKIEVVWPYHVYELHSNLTVNPELN